MKTTEGKSDRVARAFGSNILTTPLTLALSLGASVLLVRTLSKHEYGLYSMATSAALSVIAFAELGLHQAIQNFMPRLERCPRRVISRLLLAVLAIKSVLLVSIACTLLFSWPWLAAQLGIDTTTAPPALRWTILAVAVSKSWMLISASFLVGCLQHRLVNRIRLGIGFLQPLLIAAGAIVGGLGGVLYGLVAAAFVECVLYTTASVRHYLSLEVEGEAGPERLARRMGTYALASHGGKMTQYFSDLPFLVLTLAGFVGSARVATFSVPADVVGKLEALLIAPIGSLIVPTIALAVASGDSANSRRAYHTICRFLLLAYLPASGLLWVAAPQILGAVFSPRYVESATILGLLGFGVFIDVVLSAPAFAALTALGSARAAVLVRAAALLTVVLYPFAQRLAPQIGPVVAFTLVNVAIAATLAAVAAARGGLGYPFGFGIRVTLCTFAAGAGVLGIRSLLGVDVIALIACLATYGVVFLIAFRLTGGLEPADGELVLRSRLPLAGPLLRIVGGRRPDRAS